MRLVPVRLDGVMRERGMTNTALARARGVRVTSQRIGQIRSGRYVPYEPELRQIAKALNVEDAESLLEPLEAGE